MLQRKRFLLVSQREKPSTEEIALPRFKFYFRRKTFSHNKTSFFHFFLDPAHMPEKMLFNECSLYRYKEPAGKRWSREACERNCERKSCRCERVIKQPVRNISFFFLQDNLIDYHERITSAVIKWENIVGSIGECRLLTLLIKISCEQLLDPLFIFKLFYNNI